MSENTIDPDELTSPGTVNDPELERRRAEEAAVREAESRSEGETKFEQRRRAEDETKFEQLRREEEGERHVAAEIVGDVPAPIDE